MGSNENSGPALVSQDIGGEMTTGRMFQGNAQGSFPVCCVGNFKNEMYCLLTFKK